MQCGAPILLVPRLHQSKALKIEVQQLEPGAGMQRGGHVQDTAVLCSTAGLLAARPPAQ